MPAPRYWNAGAAGLPPASSSKPKRSKSRCRTPHPCCAASDRPCCVCRSSAADACWWCWARAAACCTCSGRTWPRGAAAPRCCALACSRSENGRWRARSNGCWMRPGCRRGAARAWGARYWPNAWSSSRSAVVGCCACPPPAASGASSHACAWRAVSARCCRCRWSCTAASCQA